MKRLASFLLFLALSLCATSQDQRRLTILFTNDLHSRVTGYSPESEYTPLTTGDDNTRGGFARIASIIRAEKEKSDEGAFIVVDAGDFLMGTLFQSLEVSSGFQLQLMKKMGYDVVAIGNHEFDFGPEKLASIVSSANNGGPIPVLLLSNAVFNPKKVEDDSLEELFTGGIIGRKSIIERGGIKIGFFSLMGKVADENAAFAPPVTFSKQVTVAKKMVKELKAERCDMIVCLSHSGVSKDKNGSWGGEDVEIAEKVKGIDIIISGHTHTRLEDPIIVNGIPVVQTGEYGQFTGKITVIKSNDRIIVEDFSLIPVNDDVKGDPLIHDEIEEQKKLITSGILSGLGMDYTTPVAESSYLLECNEQGDFENSNLGPLVADAIYDYVNDKAPAGTDLAMVAVGVIRDRLVPGVQTAPDIFRLMSMGSGKDLVPGYPLARLYVTGKELKNILEILQVAYKSDPANYCFYSGVKVKYDPNKGLLRKIQSIEVTKPDGTSEPVGFSKKNKKLYSVTANSYMLQFIGIIKKMSFGLINVVPKDAAGEPVRDMQNAVIDMDESREGIQEGKEWLSLIHYLRSMKDVNGNSIPDISDKYRDRQKNVIIVSD